jgi:hypothetical protein
LGSIAYQSTGQINISSGTLSAGSHSLTITNNCGNSSSYTFTVVAPAAACTISSFTCPYDDTNGSVLTSVTPNCSSVSFSGPASYSGSPTSAGGWGVNVSHVHNNGVYTLTAGSNTSTATCSRPTSTISVSGNAVQASGSSTTIPFSYTGTHVHVNNGDCNMTSPNAPVTDYSCPGYSN